MVSQILIQQEVEPVPSLPLIQLCQQSRFRVAVEGNDEDDADCVVVVVSIGTGTEGYEHDELEEHDEDDFSVTVGDLILR